MFHLYRDLKYFDFGNYAAITNGRWLALILFFYLHKHGYGQPLHQSGASAFFRDTSGRLKTGYLEYPFMAESLNKWKNETCARHKIVRKVVLQEANDHKDTLAIVLYNKQGFIVEKDSFFVGSYDQNRYFEKLSYSYNIDERTVTETRLLKGFSPEGNPVADLTSETVFYYDQHNWLVRRDLFRKDTLINEYENDSTGIIKAGKAWQIVGRDTLKYDFCYHYTYDHRGRILSAGSLRTTIDNRAHAVFYKKFSAKKGSSETAHTFTKFVYNDTLHSITYFYGDKCAGTYYIHKRSHIIQDYCCPATDDAGVIREKTTICFDKKGRIKNVRTAILFDKDLCENNEGADSSQAYTYNRTGLLAGISSGSKKTAFRYLKK